jgi:PAS domain-containing protein
VFVANAESAQHAPSSTVSEGLRRPFRGPRQSICTDSDVYGIVAGMGRPLTAEEYRLLVRHSPVMIWRSGLDVRLLQRKVARVYRAHHRARDGDGWADGVHHDDLDRCVAHYLDHFHRRESFEMDYRLRRHDGEYRWIFDRGVPFTDDGGAFRFLN